MVFISIGIGVLVLIGLGLLAFELQYRRRPGNDLELTLGHWQETIATPGHRVWVGEMELVNRTHRLEIMVPQVWATTQLLARSSLAGITCETIVTPAHEDAPARADGYWFAYIVKIRKTTRLKVTIEIRGEDLSTLEAAWVQVHYLTYGPQGRIPKSRHLVLPLASPPELPAHPQWKSVEQLGVLPIRTHLLTHLDDPVAVVQRYVQPYAQPGDIVTIGETPLAIMQGRWRHPSDIQPGWLARRLCYYFLPTSSLATACGLQSLVDLVGPWRVALAFIGGAIAKIFGQPGGFYQLAGEQARLIDDVTGTLPPYDQFIVLGPDRPQAVVDRLYQTTGLAAAIVDVNDLRAVKVLAASQGTDLTLLETALRGNPAGNADEQTPLVLIRPPAAR